MTFHIAQITTVSLETKKDEIFYIFKSNVDLKGDADIEKRHSPRAIQVSAGISDFAQQV